MAYQLEDKTILITGSTDGLGLTLAKQLAKLKASIIVHGRDQLKIDRTILELSTINPSGKYSGILCDLVDLAQIEKSFSSISSLDILINNAGVWLEGNTIDARSDKIIELLNVNLGAPLLIIRTLLPVLKKANFSQVLNVVSIAGIEIPDDYFHTIYTATKFGLQAFSEAIAKEYANTNLRVMGYYPGGMETKIFNKSGMDYKKHEPWMFDPQESVDAMIFMLSRDPKINIKRMDLINHLEK